MRDIESTPVNKSIACAIVSLARSLGLEITAEGIEKLAEKEVLMEMGCREGQGFLISPALPAHELPAWLTVHRIRTRKPARANQVADN